MTEERHSFPPGVVENLKTYVYRLIDPRNGETFYVGKGTGDRVYAHIRAQVEGDDLSNKLKRIRDIRNAGFEVGHVIHRHSMDDKTAFEVEGALIDAYPGLTTEVAGHDWERGASHADEIIRRYAAEPAVFKHKAMLISVNRSSVDRDLYEATRHAWKVSPSKAQQAEVILATLQGMIRGAFIAHECGRGIQRWMRRSPRFRCRHATHLSVQSEHLNQPDDAVHHEDQETEHREEYLGRHGHVLDPALSIGLAIHQD